MGGRRMSDLVSREWLFEEYDKQHEGPPGGARKIIEEAPAVPAIPTEWIRQQMCDYPGMESAMWSKLLRLWREEVRKQW